MRKVIVTISTLIILALVCVGVWLMIFLFDNCECGDDGASAPVAVATSNIEPLSTSRFHIGYELAPSWDFNVWALTSPEDLIGQGEGNLHNVAEFVQIPWRPAGGGHAGPLRGTVVNMWQDTVVVEWEWVGGNSMTWFDPIRNIAVEDVYIVGYISGGAIAKAPPFAPEDVRTNFNDLFWDMLHSSGNTTQIWYNVAEFTGHFVFHVVVIPIYTVDFIFRNHGAPDTIVSQRVKHGWHATELPYDHPIENGFAFSHWEVRNHPNAWAFDFSTPITNNNVLLFPVFEEVEYIEIVFHNKIGEPFHTANAEFVPRATGAGGDFRIPFATAPAVNGYDWDGFWWFDSADNFGLVNYQVFFDDADYRMLWYLSPFIRNGRVYLFTTYNFNPDYHSVTFLYRDGSVLFDFNVPRFNIGLYPYVTWTWSIFVEPFIIAYHTPRWELVQGYFAGNMPLVHDLIFQLYDEEHFTIATFLCRDEGVLFEHRFAFSHETIEMPLPPERYGYWFRAWLSQRWTPTGGYEYTFALWTDNPFFASVGAWTTVHAITRTYIAEFIYAPLVTLLCRDGTVIWEDRLFYFRSPPLHQPPEIYGYTFLHWNVIEGYQDWHGHISIRTVLQAIYTATPYVRVVFMDWDGNTIGEVQAWFGRLSAEQIPNPTVFLAGGRKLSSWFNPDGFEIDGFFPHDTIFIAICITDENWTPPPSNDVAEMEWWAWILIVGTFAKAVVIGFYLHRRRRKRRRSKK